MSYAGIYNNYPQFSEFNPLFARTQTEWIDKKLKPVTPVAGMLAKAYADKARAFDYVQANIELRETTEKLQRHDLNLSWPDDELVAWCERKAKKGSELLAKAELTEQEAKLNSFLESAMELINKYGLKINVEDYGVFGVLKRLADPQWWRRQARKLQRQAVENIAIQLRRVRKGREIYCSDETVSRRSAQRLRNRRYLEATEAENEEGQKYTLAELSDLSISNPKIRRGELMVRVRGFDEVAQLLDHVREFWTLTTPSRFHRFTTIGNVVRENPHYDGSTPREAQQWLSKMWARVRTALSRLDIRLYGFRVVEAHHDGTPHWHAAIFYAPMLEDGTEAAPIVHRVVKKYFLIGTAASDSKERGAKEHRVKIDTIDPERGDAAGYLAKYITKAIDAGDASDLMQQDLYGYDAGESARRVEAWASCHGIRQFQQIGGASVSAWRELRRAMYDEATQLDLLDAPLTVQKAAEAADEGDWHAYIILMGGPTVKRNAQTVRLGYWHEYDQQTGECKSRVQNKYGEEAEAALFGITYEGGAVLTRHHQWKVSRVNSEKDKPEENKEIISETNDTLRKVDAQTEWKPWAFDILKDYTFGRGVCFSGAPPGAPLESCQ